MADGLDSDFDLEYILDCADCTVGETCCDESCEARLWIAPCGTIDYETGEVNTSAFCEPSNYVLGSFNPNRTIREKKYQGCKRFRKNGPPDPTFDITFDICQGDSAHGILLSPCPFDYIVSPKANNLNFELNPSIHDQRTKAWWGRGIADNAAWEFPEDDCQTMSLSILTDGYCWETKIESLIAA